VGDDEGRTAFTLLPINQRKTVKILLHIKKKYSPQGDKVSPRSPQSSQIRLVTSLSGTLYGGFKVVPERSNYLIN